MTHTKGPWRRSTRARWCVVSPQHGKTIAVMANTNKDDPSEQEGDANARLIAAAPALLEAALFVDSFISEHLEWWYDNGIEGTDDTEHAIVEALRAAIQEATGEGKGS